MPNGIEWAVVALGAARRRRRRRAAEHVPAAAGARGAAPHRGRRAPRARPRVPRSRLPRRPRGHLARSSSPGTGLSSTRCPRLRSSRCGTPTAVRRRRRRRPASSSPRWTRRCDPPTTSPIVFTSGSRGTPKGVIHTHGGALGATAAGLEVRRLDSRRPPLHPDAVLLDRRARHRPALRARRGRDAAHRGAPEPARTLPFLERERVTLFRGWPDQAAALAARPAASPPPTSRPCARAASTRCCPPAQQRRARRSGRTCSA